MSEGFDRQDYIVDVEWRWTGVPVTVLGLHASVLLGIPLIFATLLSKWAIFGWVGYILIVAMLKMRFNLGPVEYAQMLIGRLLTGNRWSVR